jgi:hypothetical protein
MDGLSALSVAASVAQFIEFGSSLVLKSQEIYNPGMEHWRRTSNLLRLPNGFWN